MLSPHNLFHHLCDDFPSRFQDLRWFGPFTLHVVYVPTRHILLVLPQ